MLRSIGKQSGESVESVQKKKRKAGMKELWGDFSETLPPSTRTVFGQSPCFIDTARIVCGRAYATIRCPSVDLSICYANASF